VTALAVVSGVMLGGAMWTAVDRCPVPAVLCFAAFAVVELLMWRAHRRRLVRR
jgi:hypothetical protein